MTVITGHTCRVAAQRMTMVSVTPTAMAITIGMMSLWPTPCVAGAAATAAPVDRVSQASVAAPPAPDTARTMSATGPEAELAALQRLLERVDEGDVWTQRRLIRQIDALRIEQASVGVIDFARVMYSSSDGLEIPAYLFRPLRDTGPPMPAVIYAHGGQHGWFRASLMRRIVPLVQRGYVVLAPDYRSSAGYSQSFYEAADYGGKEIDDMLSARDYLATLPAVDGERIAIAGMSHGGYNALMSLIRAPGKFAAAVDFFGPTDLVWRLTAPPGENPNAEPGDYDKFARMVGATIDAAPERYRARSPRYLADRIRDPLLILHGDEDSVVLLQESQWLATALEAAGNRSFAFHVITGGKHGYPDEAWDRGWRLAFEFLDGIMLADPNSAPEIGDGVN